MNHLDLLLPFGLPQAEMARDVLRECKTPALAQLLARSTAPVPTQEHDPFSRALPHEHWLARQLGLPLPTAPAPERGDSPSAAAAILRAHAQDAAEGHWFIVQPAHLHVARDHLVLTTIDQLALADAESRLLFQSALPLCEEHNRTLLYVDAQTWLLRADDWAGLRTSSPLAASGRNIDIWMPAGPGEQAWRKLQNEIQMQWFSEALNEAREKSGRKPVNSLWLWGGTDTAAPAGNMVYQRCFNLSGWPHSAASHCQAGVGPNAVLADPARHALLMLDALMEPGLADEWGVWLERIEALDLHWFGPLLQAVRDKRLDRLSLILSGQDKLVQLVVTASSLRKFWVKPTLARLAS